MRVLWQWIECAAARWTFRPPLTTWTVETPATDASLAGPLGQCTWNARFNTNSESSDQTSCFMPCSSMTGAVPTGAKGEQKVPLLSPYRFLAASRLNANAGIPCIANRHSRTICSCGRKHHSLQCAVRGFARCYDTVHKTRTRLF